MPEAGLTVLIGGTRSGKSAIAERLLADEEDVTYIATGAADDPEMAARITAHRERRPAGWATVETADVAVAIAAAPGAVLVDSVGAWVRARMDAEDLWAQGDLDGLCDEAAGWVTAASGPIVVVAEQVGAGIVAVGAGTRRWVDTVGAVTSLLVERAARALLVVAGRAVELRPATPPLSMPPPATPATPSTPAPTVTAGRAAPSSTASDLGRHGDAMVPLGALDLAVNVAPDGPPPHVRAALAAAEDGRYPSQAHCTEVVAAHLGVSTRNVLLLAGAAEAFWLLPHTMRFRRAAIVAPTFTAPEAALRACGVEIVHVPRDASRGWALQPELVPDDADLVVTGNPNNPTGTLDEPAEVISLCRPGRVVLVDEAFMDHVVDDRSSLAGAVVSRDLLVVRSVTKLWGVPGVRAGYLSGPAHLVERMRAHQQPWPVSAAALAVIAAAVADEAWRREAAVAVAVQRTAMVQRLGRIPGVVVHDGAANFVLLQVAGGPAVHRALLARGIAVRPSTFPLLSADFLRVAVRDAAATARLAAALEEVS